MSRLRDWYTSFEPLFQRGGRLARLRTLYETGETLLFQTLDVTRGAPHARDALNLHRVMSVVVHALIPSVLVGIWNTGYQANAALDVMGFDAVEGWRGSMIVALGAGFDAASFYDNLLHGLAYFVPVYLVVIVTAGFWEMLFAGIRDQDVNEGFIVTALIYTLILPPTTPLWQVAIGISFGVVFGKEIFGGTGKNFLNPALLGWAFLYFAYPASHSGEEVWVAVDGYTGATPLAIGAVEGLSGIVDAGFTWTQAFLGQLPASLGSASAAACLLGALWLVFTGIASWRIMAACVLGLVIPAVLFGGIDTENPMFALPWHWHLVLGGFAFGAVFVATDPVSSPDTLAGHWIYGLLIGFMTWVIRVINPGFPEGVMLAILFGNIFAPIIDHFVIRANVRRRLKRNG